MTPIERADTTPSTHFTFSVGSGGDVDAAPLVLKTLGRPDCQGASILRWEGSGAAVLWVSFLEPRGAASVYETSQLAPKIVEGIHYWPINFLREFEAHAGRFASVHPDTTDGIWSGKFA